MVTRQELLRAGVTARQIERLLESGALIRVYPGVYRVGHRAPSVEARCMAAVKAWGRRGAERRRGAPARAVKGKAPQPEVTAPTRRRVRGVDAAQQAGGATRFRGIPVTNAPRTLIDIAADLPEDELAKACHEAGVRFGTTPRQVDLLLARRPRTKGAAKLRRIIKGDSPILLSRMEKRFRRLLKEANKPLPQSNVRIDGHYVDCRWPEHRLTVELDSYRFHNSRHSWEQGDRRRRAARARGDEFRRYTSTDVFDEPEGMLAELPG